MCIPFGDKADDLLLVKVNDPKYKDPGHCSTDSSYFQKQSYQSVIMVPIIGLVMADLKQ